MYRASNPKVGDNPGKVKRWTLPNHVRKSIISVTIDIQDNKIESTGEIAGGWGKSHLVYPLFFLIVSISDRLPGLSQSYNKSVFLRNFYV